MGGAARWTDGRRISQRTLCALKMEETSKAVKKEVEAARPKGGSRMLQLGGGRRWHFRR